MMKKPKKEKGITLIALVITIIVMLILVAVTVSITINGGLLEYAGKTAKETTVAQDMEKIQAGITTSMMEQVTLTGETTITKEHLENFIATNTDEVTVSDKRPGDEYTYVVTLNGRQYGIKENNEVEYLEGGIYNKYIYVTYVNEATPKYLFKNTVTQEDVDKEVKGSNIPYTIIGVSNEEEGTYVTEGTITGKSGTLNILDLQKANFEYTLTDFFHGDDLFYVKIQINNSIEKIQKIVVAQGDEVTYEEMFKGIIYTGNWIFVEDANCSGGAIAYSDTIRGKN